MFDDYEESPAEARMGRYIEKLEDEILQLKIERAQLKQTIIDLKGE